MTAAGSEGLPALRRDLEILPAPPGADGSDEYTLYDRLSGRYKRLGWGEAMLLAHWREGMSAEALQAAVHRHTTLRLAPGEAEAFCRQADAAGLTRRSQVRPGMQLEAEARAARGGWLNRFVVQYLFLRIPLVRPERFLEQSLPWVRLLVSAPALLLFGILIASGIVLVASRFDLYVHTFLAFLTWQGMLAYAVTLVGVKAVHELSHAYTATAFGARVRSMGLVLIVLWPIPYSDVTDAWRLESRRRRFWIGFAGVSAELVVAGLALFGWAVVSDGILRSVFFLVSAITVVSTVAVNLNPAMRFDGYYLLSDLWGIDNLQPRAFALTKWALHKYLLGAEVDPPEEPPRRRRLLALVAYSLYAWGYRFFLYIGIALVIYHRFWKAIGLALFAVEIVQFLVRPLLREVKAVWELRKRIRPRPANLLAGLLLLAALAWLALPLPRTRLLPAILVPVESRVLYVPADGTLGEVPVERGAHVRRGDLLFRVQSRRTETELRVLAREIRILETALANAALREETRTAIPEILEELETARAERAALAEEAGRFAVRAEIDGEVVDWDETLRPGMAVGRDQVAGRLAQDTAVRVEGFVAEADAARLDLAAGGLFYPARGGAPVAVSLRLPHPAPAETIPYRSLTSLAGGPIPAMEEAGMAPVPVGGWFRIRAMPLVESPATRLLWQRGALRVRTRPRSRLAALLERSWRVALRELDF